MKIIGFFDDLFSLILILVVQGALPPLRAFFEVKT